MKDFAGTRYGDVPGDRSATTHAQRARLVLVRRAHARRLPARSRRRNSSVPVGSISKRRSPSHDRRPQLGRNPFTQAGRRLTSSPSAPMIVEAWSTRSSRCASRRHQSDADFSEGRPLEEQRSPSSPTSRVHRRSVRGWRNLNPLRPFHSPRHPERPGDEIYDELVDGRIVIVDLHVGAERVTKATERVDHATACSSARRRCSPPASEPRTSRSCSRRRTTCSRPTATRTIVTSGSARQGGQQAQPRHDLRHAGGVRCRPPGQGEHGELGRRAPQQHDRRCRNSRRFYDFGSFADAIIASEDRGYVRLKTLSSPYIVPVQIDRYDIELVNEARAAAGDPPLQAPGVGQPARLQLGSALAEAGPPRRAADAIRSHRVGLRASLGSGTPRQQFERSRTPRHHVPAEIPESRWTAARKISPRDRFCSRRGGRLQKAMAIDGSRMSSVFATACRPSSMGTPRQPPSTLTSP